MTTLLLSSGYAKRHGDLVGISEKNLIRIWENVWIWRFFQYDGLSEIWKYRIMDGRSIRLNLKRWVPIRKTPGKWQTPEQIFTFCDQINIRKIWFLFCFLFIANKKIYYMNQIDACFGYVFNSLNTVVIQ